MTIDIQLVADAKNGSKESTEKLYLLCKKTLNNAASKIKKRFPCLDKSDIEQDLFIVFYRCIQGFNPEKGKDFTRYLNRAIYNVCPEYILKDRVVPVGRSFINYFVCKKNGRYVPEKGDRILDSVHAKFEKEQEMADRETPYDIASRKETSDIIHEALSRLPVRLRFIVDRYYGITVPQWSIHEIIDALGISSQRVHVLRTIGLMLMDKIITNDYNPQDI